jgi:hypothetical protein
MPVYTLVLRDAQRERVMEIEDFAQLEMRARFNDVGTFALELPAGSAAARRATAADGLIVERDGVVVFSGPITGHARRWSDRESVVTLRGVDDTVHLRDALARPVPDGPPYDAAEADVRTGVCSTVQRAYVAANIGPGARWATPGLVLGADANAGAIVTGRARFVPLLELLQSLALASAAAAGAEPGFRVVQAGTALEFQTYGVADRTAFVILSPLLGNLTAFEYDMDGPEVNHVVVGGGGEGTARLFVEHEEPGSQATWNRRVQAFRDRRDTDDPVELAQAADEELAEKAERAALTVSPVDTEAVAYGRDYWLGDRVTVVVTQDGATPEAAPEPLVEVQDIVREVRITLTPDGAERVEPSVGTPASGRANALRAGAAQRQLARRLSVLERR